MAIIGVTYAVSSSTPANALEFSISISPPSEALHERLTAQSLVSQLSETENPSSLDVLSSSHADYQRFLATLYEFGYFGSVISITLDGREASDLSTVTPPSNVERAVVTIQKGPKFKFGRANITPLAPHTVLPPEFKTGKTANTKLLEETVEASVTGWKDVGYPKVQPKDQNYTVNHNTSIFNADVTLSTGRKARIGSVSISGNKDVRAQRVEEILGLERGRVYSPEEIKDAAHRLRRTEAFKSVVLEEAETIDDQGYLDFQVRVEEQLPRRFGFGGELSNDDGASLSAYWLHRNLFGGAERFKLSAEINGIGSLTEREEYDITGRYERPATFGRDTDLFVQGQLNSKSEETYDLDRLAFGVGIKRYVSEDYEYELSLGFVHAVETDIFGEDEYTLLTGRFDGTLDRRDDSLRPTKGYYMRPSLLPYISVDGTRSGVRAHVEGRTYFALSETRRSILAIRGQIGSIYGSSIPDTPADFLFYSGGSNTVRGFPYRSVGLQANGITLTGGRSFLGGSTEIRVSRESGLGFVGFLDVGLIGADSIPSNFENWHAGAGIGLRYDTGIGPLRLDVATPVRGESSGSDYQIYIGIGEAF